MKLKETELKGVYIIENFSAEDNRGVFTKTYHRDFFKKNNLCVDYKESYFSVSRKNVIRGMHFQLPPYDHEKLVYTANGEIMDVVLDLRKSSETYGKSISVVLSDQNHKSIYIPKGLAHGFKSNSDHTVTVYNVSTVYNKQSDFGIKYDSFDFNWKVNEPIISDRDMSFMSLEEFGKTNPF